MATRYLTALDYSDWHTSHVLRKHAKKRPLGELEWRYQYRPQQPLLSCRTVQVDACCTATVRRMSSSYRSRSTSDILQQQQAAHGVFRNGTNRRMVTSAPTRRGARTGQGRCINDTTPRGAGTARVPVQGRSPTSMSQTSDSSRPRSTFSAQRPRSRVKSAKATPNEGFMVITVDKSMLETRRSYPDLTTHTHAHWQPVNGRSDQGHVQRRQKSPDRSDVTSPTRHGAWMTCGGTPGKASGRAVRVSTSVPKPDDFYSIEGLIGCRVAQHHQKGDTTDVGVNGKVMSHDVNVKRWLKDADSLFAEEKQAVPTQTQAEGSDQAKEEEEEDEGRVSGSLTENPPSPVDELEQDLFKDAIVQPVYKVTKPREEECDSDREQPSGHCSTPRTLKTPSNCPLNWDDQVSRPDVMVLSTSPAPMPSEKENLCETHPVVFNHGTGLSPPRPRLASAPAQSHSPGYRIKQRPISSSGSRGDVDSLPESKVKAVMCDQYTAEEEQLMKEMSIEDVIQTRLEVAASTSMSPIPGLSSARRSLPYRSNTANARPSEKPQWAATPAHSPRTPRCTSDKPGQRATSHPVRTSSASRTSVRSLGESRSMAGKSSASFQSPERRLITPRPSSSVPVARGAREAELSMVTPAVLSRGTKAQRQNSAKGVRQTTMAMAAYSRGAGGVSSINAGPLQGDTEFIQISQPIRNPNSTLTPLAYGMHAMYSPYPVNSAASSPLPPHHFHSPPRINTPETGVRGRGEGEGGCIFDPTSTSLMDQPSQVVVSNEEGGRRSAPTPQQQQMGFTADSANHGEHVNATDKGAASSTLQLTPHSDSVGDAATAAAAATTTPQPALPARAISIPTAGDQLEEDEEGETEGEETLDSQRGERSGDQLEEEEEGGKKMDETLDSQRGERSGDQLEEEEEGRKKMDETLDSQRGERSGGQLEEEEKGRKKMDETLDSQRGERSQSGENLDNPTYVPQDTGSSEGLT